MSFITIEGGEGTGKSTLIQGLAGALADRGIKVVATREPGGTIGAEEIRELLVTGDTARWSPTTELLLINAARRDHVERIIQPALDAGTTVLCDRFIDSTRVYQGMNAVSADMIAALHASVIGLNPDRTIVLDVPSEVGLERSAARGGADRFEAKGADFHQTVRDGFLAIAAAEPTRCVVIDSTQPKDTVLSTALAALNL